MLTMMLVLSAAAADVSYLGPAGTYTEEAAQFFFQNGETLNPKETVNDAIADLLSGEANYAVIPQENTLGGAVVNYVDALIGAEYTFVVGEVVLPISQTLMGVPGAALEDITTVCSHAQGLTQSAQWRSENLPDAGTEEMSSTAAAASYVASHEGLTIINEDLGAEYYGIAFRSGDAELCKAVDDAVQALVKNGTYAKIAAKPEYAEIVENLLFLNK